MLQEVLRGICNEQADAGQYNPRDRAESGVITRGAPTFGSRVQEGKGASALCTTANNW